MKREKRRKRLIKERMKREKKRKQNEMKLMTNKIKKCLI